MKRMIIAAEILMAASAFAGGNIGINSYLPDGTLWRFETYTDTNDHWDSTKSENPPLSVKRAKDLAISFMGKVPRDPGIIEWRLSAITLQKMSDEPEHWIYVIRFIALHSGAWTGPAQEFTVLVRFDGSIPEPLIEKPLK